MIDILNHYTLGFDQDRHIEDFSPGIKCRACLAPYNAQLEFLIKNKAVQRNK